MNKHIVVTIPPEATFAERARTQQMVDAWMRTGGALVVSREVEIREVGEAAPAWWEILPPDVCPASAAWASEVVA